MKKIILTSAALLFFFAAATAQTETTPSTDATKAEIVVQDKKTEIKYDELPQTVKTTFSGDAYKGWEVLKVWHNETKEQYELEVKNATETKTLKFDKDGKEVVTK